MAKKKKQDEAYLAKRREQKKISMRKAREKLKNNPEKHEEIKLKRRENYQKLKEEGKIKSIDDFSSREQRRIRKDWKTRSSSYRKRQKNKEKELEFVENNTPPGSPIAIEIRNVELPSTSRQKESGKKVARRNREKKNKEIKQLQEKLKKTNRKLLKYKTRLSRLKKQNLGKLPANDTPRKVVENLLKDKTVSPEIRRKLLFGEVLAKQVKENFKDKNRKNKKLISCVTGNIIRRYKLVGTMRLLTSRRAIGLGHLEKKG